MSSVRLPRLVWTANFRLASLYALLFGASVAILGFVIYWTMEAQLERLIATRINAELAFFHSKFHAEGLAELVDEVHERLETAVDGAHLEYLVVDAQGNHLVGNLPSMPDKVGWNDVTYPKDARNPSGRQVRLRVIALDRGIRLAVGDDLKLIREIDAALFGALGWVFLTLIPLSLAGGLILSFRYLKRVDLITRTAEAIVGGDLSRRIPSRGTNDDLDRLSGTLNHMLDRIADLMESLRQASSDIAHNLRTPLTRLRNKIEMLAGGELSGPEHKAALEATITETDQILETFSALLRIAQIEAGTRRAGFHEIDLSKLLGTIVEDFSAAAEADSKVLTATVECDLLVVGDRDLLTQMLANLIENAILHTPAGSHIELKAFRTEAGIVASVADDGAGVPGPERQRIFRRFYRLERSRTIPGSGLGLALVAAVADLHGIGLSAEDNAPGLKVLLKFNAGSR